MPTSTAELPQTLPLDDFGRIAADVICIQCGQNLRGTLAAQKCPKCGQKNELSIQDYLHQLGDIRWRRKVVWGMYLIVATILLAGLHYAHIRLRPLSASSLSPPGNWVWFYIVLQATIELMGVWMMTAAAPRGAAWDRRRTAWLARFSVGIFFAFRLLPLLRTLAVSNPGPVLMELLLPVFFVPSQIIYLSCLPAFLRLATAAALMQHGRGWVRRLYPPIPRPWLMIATALILANLFLVGIANLTFDLWLSYVLSGQPPLWIDLSSEFLAHPAVVYPRTLLSLGATAFLVATLGRRLKELNRRAGGAAA